ncbi:alpha/beta hydrolase [Flavobacterium sp. DG1-102-2]|uniref:alpha/beta fold hydrolase n=1 Tax=Flavobacterium sp. DG1-102-2 TaxID=3081663 RepID=UPI002949AAA7|nr:alpha/beta hydrolase [Flavobacterium sp. DG1-102-2]MDV6169786.1 alpha/beta hydrolase [Flavobacterium sp. DG1-102-2]
MEQISSTSLSGTKLKKKNIILLHGLFGNLSNWQSVKAKFEEIHNVYIPELPLYKKNSKEANLDHYVSFLREYIILNNITDPVLIGNSLGGHIALLYTLEYPTDVQKLVLTGSSGLYESSLDISFPRINDFEFIADKVKEVFYNQEAISDALIEDVYATIQDREKALSVVRTAKAARNQNLKDTLYTIACPVLLIWGMQDIVTPLSVAEEFFFLLPNAHLHLINHCGHAPMMEQPEEFNKKLEEFLNS